MKMLYVGETWNGSSARAMRDALMRCTGVEVEDIGEDLFVPHHNRISLRLARRALMPMYRAEIDAAVRSRTSAWRPDVLCVYKGASIGGELIRWAKSQGILTVNVFPDYSPHAYGQRLQAAMGEYDLIASTKPFHPELWESLYGYRNRCICIPHGYDPRVHLWSEPPVHKEYDLAIAASWRPQYHELVMSIAADEVGRRLSVALAGSGWRERASSLPAHWHIPGPMLGRSYGEFLRAARIVVAPLHQEVIVRGQRQPGDVDTTRTYELAAACCFFAHVRTDYVQGVYDEKTEVPMWSSPEELIGLINHYLPLDSVRREMAARAHVRAVPDYSIDARAGELIGRLESCL